jgi:hypothetical protein
MANSKIKHSVTNLKCVPSGLENNLIIYVEYGHMHPGERK